MKPLHELGQNRDLYRVGSPFEGLRGTFADLEHSDGPVIGKFLGLYDQRIAIAGHSLLATPLSTLYLTLGAKVCMMRRTVGELEKTAGIIGRYSQHTDGLLYTGVDVTKPDSVAAAAQFMRDNWGGCDILLNFAGGVNREGNAVGGRKLVDTTHAARMQQIELDYGGAVNMALGFEPLMMETGNKPCVVFVDSMSACFPGLGGAGVSYGPAKSAVRTFMWELARQWSPWGARVNTIAIGFGIGDQNRGILLQPDLQSPSERGQRFLNDTPLKDFMRGDDVAGTYIGLTSSTLAGQVTGQTLAVDGGFLIGRW